MVVVLVEAWEAAWEAAAAAAAEAVEAAAAAAWRVVALAVSGWEEGAWGEEVGGEAQERCGRNYRLSRLLLLQWRHDRPGTHRHCHQHRHRRCHRHQHARSLLQVQGMATSCTWSSHLLLLPLTTSRPRRR